MSKKLLIATLTAFSITALSGTGGASTPSYDASPIVLEQNSLPGTSEFRFQDEGLPQAFNGRGIEAENNHIAKTGLLSGIKKVGGAIKSAAKKVGKTVATGAKRAASGVANGVKQAAKGIAKSPLGTAIKNTAKSVKNTAVKVASAVKKYFKKRS